MSIGNCPKCNCALENVNIKDGEGFVNFSTQWKIITLCCPLCHAILGAQIDTVALKAEIIEEVGGILGR